MGINKKTLSFLKKLEKNNNKDWFANHRVEFEDAKTDFEGFVTRILPGLRGIDPFLRNLDIKKSIFRIYRDTRFTHDKRPFKNNMGARLVGNRIKLCDRAGFYIHVQPKNCFLAGGAYTPTSSWLRSIRNEIDYEGEELRAILESESFKKYFGELGGAKLKTAPRDFPKDHVHIDLLRQKSFLAQHFIDEPDMCSNMMEDKVLKVFEAIRPLNEFLNRTLAD